MYNEKVDCYWNEILKGLQSEEGCSDPSQSFYFIITEPFSCSISCSGVEASWYICFYKPVCNPGQSSLDINTVETVHCVILIPVYEQYGVADSKFWLWLCHHCAKFNYLIIKLSKPHIEGTQLGFETKNLLAVFLAVLTLLPKKVKLIQKMITFLH